MQKYKKKQNTLILKVLNPHFFFIAKSVSHKNMHSGRQCISLNRTFAADLTFGIKKRHYGLIENQQSTVA